METEKIEITKEEYILLKKEQEILRALESAGVDNWEGYDMAMESIWDQ